MMVRIYPDDIANLVCALFVDGSGDFRMARIDTDGHLQMDAVDLGDLEHALQSVGTDRLQVRGEDQLFSYLGRYMQRVADGSAGAGTNSLNGTFVPAGEVWVVTHAACYDLNNAFTDHSIACRAGVLEVSLDRGDGAAADATVSWTGHIYMEEGDRMRATLGGVTAGDVIRATFFGYKMTLE